MPNKFDLKLSSTVKKIVDVYLRIKPDPLGVKKNTSAYLRPIIYEKINELLDFLESEREKNIELQEILAEDEFKEVIEALNSSIRFET